MKLVNIKHFFPLAFVIAIGLVVSACQPTDPETIIKTVIVEKEGETIVETVVVTVEPPEQIEEKEEPE